jgi:hypothetical protein
MTASRRNLYFYNTIYIHTGYDAYEEGTGVGDELERDRETPECE